LRHGLIERRRGGSDRTATKQTEGGGNLKTVTNLVELHKDLNGELGADGPAGDEVVQRLGEAGADGGPPVELEGGHPLHGNTPPRRGLIV
jgi:hypothetical protein